MLIFIVLLFIQKVSANSQNPSNTQMSSNIKTLILYFLKGSILIYLFFRRFNKKASKTGTTAQDIEKKKHTTKNVISGEIVSKIVSLKEVITKKYNKKTKEIKNISLKQALCTLCFVGFFTGAYIVHNNISSEEIITKANLYDNISGRKELELRHMPVRMHT